MQYFVYILNSVAFSEKFYVGFTEDIETRLDTHNRGGSIHTKNHKPWVMVMYTAFADKEIALDFERYLKSHSGRAFAIKHFSKSHP